MSLHVEVAGPDNGPLALLLHAFPCDASMWGAQAAALAEVGWRVAVPDLPGFGTSGLLTAEPDLTAVARVLLGWIDEHGGEPALLAGCSLGGYLLMAMLRERPDLAAALVLAGTKATADAPGAVANREAMAQRVEADDADVAAVLRDTMQPALLGPTSWASRPEAVARVEAWVDAVRGPTVAWYQRAMSRRRDSLDVLAGRRGLVLWGPDDALSGRSEQDLMVAALGEATFVEVPDAGHLAVVERPDVTSEAIVAFAGV